MGRAHQVSSLNWEAVGHQWLWRDASVFFRDADPANTSGESCHLHRTRSVGSIGYGPLPLSDAIRISIASALQMIITFTVCIIATDRQIPSIKYHDWWKKDTNLTSAVCQPFFISIIALRKARLQHTETQSWWKRLSSYPSPTALKHTFPTQVLFVPRREMTIRSWVVFLSKLVCRGCSLAEPPICQGRELTTAAAAMGSDTSTLITPTAMTPFQFCSSLSL